MTKRMLIDATHAEETRVVVLDGNRLEDFDVETAAKRQLKGNIYLAKVVRVEPSLQAAFVEYGGGRHGFLAFGEIHPDYYQIPVADRQRLLELQEAEARAEEAAEDAAAAADEAAEQSAAAGSTPLGVHDEAAIPGHADVEAELAAQLPDFDAAMERELDAEALFAEMAFPDQSAAEPSSTEPALVEADAEEPLLLGPEPETDEAAAAAEPVHEAPADPQAEGLHNATAAPDPAGEADHALAEPVDPAYGDQDDIAAAIAADLPAPVDERAADDGAAHPRAQAAGIVQDIVFGAEDATPETLGADYAPEAMEPAIADAAYEPEPASLNPAEGEFAPVPEPQPAGARDDGHAREDEPREERAPARFMRSYKIQEVIRRRQILLIQVVKEERGSKGAALTTYISLAGRFSVLMPNSPRGGGISRKITSTADRRRLKEVTSELQIPRGMGLIVRTAGANRPKAEIRRDCEYLLDLWDSIRETTMKSVAPALIHEEASLIKRAIRDNYSRDVDEVLVDGEAGWRAARDFMRMLMPAHARKVVLWNDPQPLFARHAVEAQLDAMLTPTVQLPSGGYLVINQTEALVAIDVNSGRSTRERGIEETALKTNLEAADEVARQLRLRDLAGLIVIDFIDMESRRNNAAVEKRMKDALKDDRARIQLGSISSFGLMEMSRQRLRPSLAETSFTACPHCGGTGHVRSTETSALAVLRAIEEEGAKRRAAEICVHVAGAIALYVLNHKRIRVAEIEARYGMTVMFAGDETLLPPQTRIEKLRAQVPGELPEPAAPPPSLVSPLPVDAEDDFAVEEEDEADEAATDTPANETAAEGEARKRRRRRRGGRREDSPAEPGATAAPVAIATAPTSLAVDPALAEQPDLPMPPANEPALSTEAAEEARGRRRGRRGGRRRRRDEPGDGTLANLPGADGDAGEDDAPASFDAPYTPPYQGPTPADPFGGAAFDFYDVMEQAEARAALPPRPEVEGQAAEATVPSAEPAAPPALPEAEPALEPERLIPAPNAAAEPRAAEGVEPQPVAVQPLEYDPVPPAPPAEAILPGAAFDQPVPLEYAAQEVLPERAAPPEPEAPPAPTLALDEPAHGDAQPTALERDERGAPAPAEPLPSEPAPSEPTRSEPVAGPITAPVIIGGDGTVAEKKRGWWRR